MIKPRILLVGENPYSFSGNAHFMHTIATAVDQTKYEMRVFAGSKSDIITNHYEKKPFEVINGIESKVPFCGEHLCQVLRTNDVDVVVFVGMDCWAYHHVFTALIELHEEKKFLWCSIFPYDTYQIRTDWLKYITPVDAPYAYSEYGFNKLKNFVPHLKYFRPALFDADKFSSYSPEMKLAERRKIFSTVEDDVFIFGFIGNNQHRKDPLRTVRAFFNVHKKLPNTVLYMHTETSQGIFNIPQYILDCGGKPGDAFLKQDNSRFFDMAKVYNTIDCLVNTSLQEGLSWTLLEAMLCGCPVIAANNTSQIELIKNGAGYEVPCTDLAFVPIQTPTGLISMESKACNLTSLEQAMIEVATKPKLRSLMTKTGFRRATDWLAHTNDINAVIKDALKLKQNSPKVAASKTGVLFAQHSSAGDVFMTTRCFEDLRKRHPNEKITYMTSPQYMNIIEGNPFIDEVVPWNDSKLHSFKTVYNPHGERILPGHWGRNSNSLLSDFYWKILMIEKPGDFFIQETKPKNLNQFVQQMRKLVILHTTGGDPSFRTYKYMSDVALELKKLGYCTFQIGGKSDFTAKAEYDFRGKLSYQETAWLVRKASYAVTVDSFVSHLCGAFGVSQICLFGSGNASVVKPNQLSGKLICMSPDYVSFCPGLGPCSGAVKNCPVRCTGIHDPKDIMKNFNLLIGG